MRMNTLFKILLIFVALGWSTAYANTTTLGGSLTGVLVQDTFILIQDDLPLADELNFTAWQKECWVDINGWEIDIQTFDDSASARISQPGGSCSGDTHAVRVVAENPPLPIPLGNSVRVDVDFWLTSWNAVRIADAAWLLDGNAVPALPDFGWWIGDAVDIGGGLYQHTVRIINDGGQAIWLTAIWILQTAQDYGTDLVILPPWFVVGNAEADVQLDPGEGVSFAVTTSGSAGLGEFIYLSFEIRAGGATPGVLEVVNYAKHEIVAESPDADLDGLPDGFDNCITVVNPNQIDTDADGIGDACDNCINIVNVPQRDTDADGHGNSCDADLSQDCNVNPIDLGLFKQRFFTMDPDADFNGDGIVNPIDLGIFKLLFFNIPGPSAPPNLCNNLP